MASMQLSLENLKDFDMGRVSVAFQKELQRVVSDMIDRPGDATARKVMLQLTLTPVIDDAGECDGTRFEFEVASKVPNRRTRVYHGNVTKKGQVVANDMSPDNANQMTIDQLDDE